VEGALTPSLLFTLASRNKISLPDDDSYLSEAALLARYDHFDGLDDFLQYYYTAMTVLIHAADFEDLAWSYFTRAQADGVVHSEISFDLQAHIARGVSSSAVMTGLTAARVRAEKELNMSTELICCFLRHLPVRSAIKLFDTEEVRAHFANGNITGIGLDSSESGFPPEPFQDLYHRAYAMGFRRTAHAGEEGPARNIESAISILKCERIDHGIRLRDDPELMRQVAQSRTMLTVCPLSNVRLKCVKSVKDLPIRKFLDAGVKFSINSDDPAYFSGFILDNYCAVQDAFDLDHAQWVEICRSSIEGSWCGAERKAAMHQMLRDVSLQHAVKH